MTPVRLSCAAAAKVFAAVVGEPLPLLFNVVVACIIVGIADWGGFLCVEEDSIARRSYGEAGCYSGSYLCFIGQSKGDSTQHGSVKGSLEASDKEDYLCWVGDKENHSVTTTQSLQHVQGRTEKVMTRIKTLPCTVPIARQDHL